MRCLLALLALAVVAGATLLEPPSPPIGTNPDEQRLCRQRTQVLIELQLAREAAVEDLLAGRATMEETVARFRDIARNDPFDVVASLRLCYPDESEEEAWRRQIGHYILGTLARHEQERNDDPSCKVSPPARIFNP